MCSSLTTLDQFSTEKLIHFIFDNSPVVYNLLFSKPDPCFLIHLLGLWSLLPLPCYSISRTLRLNLNQEYGNMIRLRTEKLIHFVFDNSPVLSPVSFHFQSLTLVLSFIYLVCGGHHAPACHPVCYHYHVTVY